MDSVVLGFAIFWDAGGKSEPNILSQMAVCLMVMLPWLQSVKNRQSKSKFFAEQMAEDYYMFTFFVCNDCIFSRETLPNPLLVTGLGVPPFPIIIEIWVVVLKMFFFTPIWGR